MAPSKGPAENPLGRLTLVIGGASSGKSLLAERLAGEGGAVTYIATARPLDNEMRAKIETHRRRRPPGWRTIEVSGPDLLEVLPGVADGVVIVDGLTLYVATAMAAAKDPEAHMNEVIQALRKAVGTVIVVSDEVGLGLVPESTAGRAFRDLLGRVNQRLAEAADNVYFVAAGLPLTLKGRETIGSDGWA
ncbi:MAG: bifunctional adenosylcobinamide kinase/adenosylcobinamide-phosphate guanylyltransferase [Actinomycetota bacterium]|nr:bifunctional adenosylcobinamide kinase/adenosylcobinamide-phosphate guanylyltransferase [Actinomycetota bacterium]